MDVGLSSVLKSMQPVDPLSLLIFSQSVDSKVTWQAMLTFESSSVPTVMLLSINKTICQIIGISTLKANLTGILTNLVLTLVIRIVSVSILELGNVMTLWSRTCVLNSMDVWF